jgi:hypothetical protein
MQMHVTNTADVKHPHDVDCTVRIDWQSVNARNQLHALASIIAPNRSARSGRLHASSMGENPGWIQFSCSRDVVRSCRERPFVELAPLIAVDEGRLRETKKALLVNRAYVPGVAERRLVADLDRVTAEKVVLAGWPRTPGWSTDAEARVLAEALARKRVRPAFPDDFVAEIERLQRRIRDKHGRSSIEGRLLEALREIRVHASPSWDAVQVLVRFLFVKDSDPEGLEGQWSRQVEAWLDLVDRNGRFTIADPEVDRLEDFTASDYVESDRLDLDWLSAGR